MFPRFNCCVFAYGATGAGKTFTMLGNKENPGVIYKTVSIHDVEQYSFIFCYLLKKNHFLGSHQ